MNWYYKIIWLQKYNIFFCCIFQEICITSWRNEYLIFITFKNNFINHFKLTPEYIRAEVICWNDQARVYSGRTKMHQNKVLIEHNESDWLASKANSAYKTCIGFSNTVFLNWIGQNASFGSPCIYVGCWLMQINTPKDILPCQILLTNRTFYEIPFPSPSKYYIVKIYNAAYHYPIWKLKFDVGHRAFYIPLYFNDPGGFC